MNVPAKWTIDRAPDLTGRVAVVTGATGGLGYETACGLAEKGATVILAGRNPDRGAAALARLQGRVAKARARFMPLDLASLTSVAAFARDLADQVSSLDILVNNAGLMGAPIRQETADRFELQFGTNYLGHFALTARLRPLLVRASGGGRVVSVASLAAWRGRVVFDDLQSRHRYTPFGAYQQSKLANLIFALELDRRAQSAGWALHSIAAHPGWSLTDIAVSRSDAPQGVAERLMRRLTHTAFRLLGQSAEAGARPILFAAAGAEASDGGYYGPSGRGERRGRVAAARVPPQARNLPTARRLWEVSERLTGVALS
ncbi:SDR family oxidoreductase [Gluconacetobacter azotocaptans]|uniref:SDR family oxidoreductase n=1 Tax=Gluconacetobacter azotocaptans TaxID=142834 RepID=A0A7W4JRA7_9PROT|nr:SDR family oxidoreductase [Gluconacetobacter azotocaptans]MBB2189305.1 SDR family oxidoreductase [Gluconacetobacter azotocaptans]GBQ32555.1 oxidoreductase [Gluconacetobacter azotocaptans DSM 13594]